MGAAYLTRRAVVRQIILPALLIPCFAVPVAGGQSLGDVARAEAERRAKVTPSGRKLTDKDLPPSSAASPAAPAPAPEPQVGEGDSRAETAQAPESEPDATNTPVQAREKHDEPYWRRRFAKTRQAVARAEQDATAVQSRLDALDAELETNPSAVRSNAIRQERNGVIADIRRLARDATDLRAELTALEERARQLNVPVDWTR
jgi:hypothetical protein